MKPSGIGAGEGQGRLVLRHARLTSKFGVEQSYMSSIVRTGFAGLACYNYIMTTMGYYCKCAAPCITS